MICQLCLQPMRWRTGNGGPRGLQQPDLGKHS